MSSKLIEGAGSDMPLQLARAGYGIKKTGFLTVIDRDVRYIEKLELSARNDAELAHLIATGKLRFHCADYTKMPEICKQSIYDAIVDYKGLDSLLTGAKAVDIQGTIKCIDQLQDAVRLGNILVCLSTLDKDTFCKPFEQRFGWVQELDGEPGEISAWYRGKSNIPATASKFKQLGLYMYVYTNTDNC